MVGSSLSVFLQFDRSDSLALLLQEEGGPSLAMVGGPIRVSLCETYGTEGISRTKYISHTKYISPPKGIMGSSLAVSYWLKHLSIKQLIKNKICVKLFMLHKFYTSRNAVVFLLLVKTQLYSTVFFWSIFEFV